MAKIIPKTISNDLEYLRQVSIPVVFPDNDLDSDIAKLEAYFNQSDITLALATVQLGIPKRMIYLKNTNIEKVLNNEKDINYNERKIMINPIVKKEIGLTEFWEACVSCENQTGLVKRPYEIEVEYQDIDGNYHTEAFQGFASTVLAHEIDHLDGILHIDKSEEILVLTPEERVEYRKKHPYKIYSKTKDYNELLKEYQK